MINQELLPEKPIEVGELEGDWTGKERLDVYKRVMYEHSVGESLEFLKISLGGLGTRMLRDSEYQIDKEIEQLLKTVAKVAES